MKNSKRLLATLLTLCIMASFVFTGTAFAADESAATLTFPAQIVNVNGTAKVELAGATADEYVSSDETIAEVSNDGIVTGKAIGRVTITAKENGEAIASVEIPVVGENLLIRNGVNHGKFESGVDSFCTNEQANKFVPRNLTGERQFWWAPEFSVYADATDGVTVVKMTTPASGEDTDVMMYTMNVTAGQRQIALRTAPEPNPGKTSNKDYSTYDYGSIPVDNNKLYEMTMWLNYDDIKTDSNNEKYMGDMSARVQYIDSTAATTYTTASSSPSHNANQSGWQFLNIVPVDRSEYSEMMYAQLYFNAKATVSTLPEGGIGSAYFADASFHEVKYDPAFTSNSGLSNVKVGFETSTQFQHLSNTGKEVISVDASGKKQTIAVTYDSVNENVATVNSSGNIKAVGAGTAVIQVTATLGGKAYTRTITFVVEKDVVDAFTLDNTNTNASYNEPTVITITKDDVPGITSEPNGDGTHTVTAPAEKENGSKFLYWAKGLTSQKKILLYKTNELTDYLPDEKYANYLIPVYEDDISAPEYYNANGQLIPGANQGTTVTMPGYGTSIGWIPYGENIYVAKYELDEPAKNITIKTTNCTTDKDEYGYGDLVTCTAQNPGGKTFKCWKKDNEIVSVDPTYTFKAWENCTVEAVYVDTDFQYTGTKMKIIIDSFSVGNDTGVMAEFIGLSGAVEKGIMFTDKESGETTNIAMTTKGSQFSVIADKAGTYVGYAILKNGSAFTLITDGAMTVSNVE